MKHALAILIFLQAILLIPFFFYDWNLFVCIIPSMIILSWYIAYGLFILCCISIVRLCKYYVKVKKSIDDKNK